MYEHPDVTREFVNARYHDLLCEADINRRMNALEISGKRGSQNGSLNHWLSELKFWEKPARRIATRA